MTLKADAVCTGGEAVDLFFNRTQGDWQRIARYIMNRHPVPLGVEEGDIVQELQLEAWRLLKRKRFKPELGKSANSFLMYNAICRAKRWLKRQRRRGGQGRVVELVSEAEELMPQRVEALSLEPEQEDRLESKAELERLLDGCTSIKTAICLVAAWQHGNAGAAGAAIYQNTTTRRLCRLDCRAEARRVVVREIQRATRSMSL